jgi:hypothetical protein
LFVFIVRDGIFAEWMFVWNYPNGILFVSDMVIVLLQIFKIFFDHCFSIFIQLFSSFLFIWMKIEVSTQVFVEY